jgi:hypothetical protein
MTKHTGATAQDLLNYLRDIRNEGIVLSDVKVGIIADTEGSETTLLSIKKISQHGNTIAVDCGLQEAVKKAEKPLIEVASNMHY